MKKNKLQSLASIAISVVLAVSSLVLCTNVNAVTELFSIDSTPYVTGTTDSLYLQNLYQRIVGDRNAVISYFGGSITYGIGASQRNVTSWRGLTQSWFTENYPDCSFTFTDASICGTGSRFGSFRAYRDLELGTNPPDLVFVEFAINDLHISEYGRDENEIKDNMRVIINSIYNANPYAEVIVVLTTDSNVYNNEESFLELQWHKEVCEEYGVAAINVGKCLIDYAKAQNGGTFTYSLTAGSTWLEYFDDYVHPCDKGHKVYASVIADYLNKSLTAEGLSASSSAKIANTVDSDVDINRYYANNAEITGFADYAATEGFTAEGTLGILKTTYENAAVSFSFYGTNAYLWAKKHQSYGNPDVYIDGEKTGVMDMFRGSEYSQNVPIAVSDVPLTEGNHTVTLVMQKGTADGYGAEFQAIAVYGDSREGAENPTVEFLPVDREALEIGEIIYEEEVPDYYARTPISASAALATSSASVEQTAESAIDGERMSHFTATEYHTMLQLDLGESKDIGGIQAWWKASDTDTFKYNIYVTETPVLSVGDNISSELTGDLWVGEGTVASLADTLTPVKSGIVGNGCGIEENGGPPENSQTITDFVAEGRYVTVYIYEGTAAVPSLWETEVYARSEVSIAYKREIAAYSSTQTMADSEIVLPTKINDGDKTTRWTASGGAYPQHVVIDLGAEYVIKSLGAYFPFAGQRGYGYKLYYGDSVESLSSFKLFEECDASSNTSFNGAFTFDDVNGEGRYLMIEMLNCTNATGWASVSEIEAFGYGISSEEFEVRLDKRVIFIPEDYSGNEEDFISKINVYGHFASFNLNVEEASSVSNDDSLEIHFDNGSSQSYRIMKGNGNIALGKTATVSSNAVNAGFVTDGENLISTATNGWNASAEDTDKGNVIIDLGAEYMVERVCLYWFTGWSGKRVFLYNVYAGTDKENLSLVADRSANTVSGIVDDSFSPVCARYIKVDILGNNEYAGNNTSRAKIIELEAYGWGITSDIQEASISNNLILVNGDFAPEAFLDTLNFEGLYGSYSLDCSGSTVSNGDTLTVTDFYGNETTLSLMVLGNIAKNKSVLATRIQSGYPTSNAVDEDFTKAWAGYAKQSSETSYYPTLVQLDLARVSDIYGIKLWFRGYDTSTITYEVYVTDTPLLKVGKNISSELQSGYMYTGETPVSDLVSTLEPTIPTTAVKCAGRDICSDIPSVEVSYTTPLTGRYVIVYIPSGQVTSASIWEMQVSGNASKNISLGKPTTAVSTQNGYTTSNINDGDEATRWNANGISVPTYITIDLLDIYDVTDITLVFPGENRSYGYKIYGSIDNHDGENLAEESALILDASDNTVVTPKKTILSNSFESPTAARYVTLYYTSVNNNATAFPGAFEFTVMGFPSKTKEADATVSLGREAENSAYVNDPDGYDSRAILTLISPDGETMHMPEASFAGSEISFAKTLPLGEYTARLEKNGYIAKDFTLNVAEDSATASITPVPGDIKGSYEALCGDGIVDIDDFARLMRAFDSEATALLRKACDINEDGLVTIADLAFIKANFGTGSH